MLFELSKDKSLLVTLSKANLDENTANLVKSQAHPTDIKKSLIDNINSKNIVEYRKYIKKAEEEETTLEQREAAKTSVYQRRKILKLIAERDGVSVQDVDEKEVPELKAEATKMIRELNKELKTRKDIGVDEEATEPSEKEIITDSSRQERLTAANQEEERRKESKKRKATSSLKKAQTWLTEVEDLVSKLKVNVTSDKKVEVMRMAEYQKFGNNITESNEVISLVMFYEKDPTYLSNKFKESLEDYNFGKGSTIRDGQQTNVLMPYRETKDGNLLPVPTKAIFVNDLDERWGKVIKRTASTGASLSDILKEMHRKRHGRQPIVDRKDSQRKNELERLQRFITGESPRIATRFKKLIAKVKSISNKTFKNNQLKDKLEETIKELEGLSTDDIIARRIRSLNIGIQNLSNVSGVEEALAEIRGIQENPEPYIKELREKIDKDIETEKEKLETVKTEIEKLNVIRPPLKRVREAIKDIQFLREDTGNEPAGKIKVILSRVYTIIVRLERIINKIQEKGFDLDEKSDDIVDRLKRGNNIDITGNQVNYAGISDIDFKSVNTLRELRQQQDGLIEEIQTIMNEYDGYVGGD